MPCRIEMPDIEAQVVIGCTDEEQLAPQMLMISVEVESLEKFPATRTDQLADTLDAAKLRACVLEIATASRVRTLERLAELLELELKRIFPRPGLTWQLTLAKPAFGYRYVQTGSH